MPIVTALPAAEDPATSHRAAPERCGETVDIGTPAALPPGVLLPSGGADHCGEPPVDPAWVSVAFQRRVAAVHRQLAPVRSRAALADSYGREAARRLVHPRATAHPRATPLQVAYALRWLELGSTGSVAITWADLVDMPSG